MAIQALELYGIIIGLLLAVVSYFLKDAAQSIKDLAKSVNEFNTYTKTNDQRVLYLEQKLDRHIDEVKPELKGLKEDVLLLKNQQ